MYISAMEGIKKHLLFHGMGIWAYDLMPIGIMPQTLYISGCRKSGCDWDEEKWPRAVFRWPEEKDMPTNIREAAQLIIQAHGLQSPILEVANPKYRLS